jgi:hypothetical protein
MGRLLIRHRLGRVERPRHTREPPAAREQIVPEVLPGSLGDRRRAGTSADKIWLEKEL